MGLDDGAGDLSEVVLDPGDGGHPGSLSGQAARLPPGQGEGGGWEGGKREELSGLWSFFGAAKTGNVVGDADDRGSLGRRNPREVPDRGQQCLAELLGHGRIAEREREGSKRGN